MKHLLNIKVHLKLNQNYTILSMEPFPFEKDKKNIINIKH